MSIVDELKQQCYNLGKNMPNKVPHENVMQMLAKVIVEKKIHDDDAFDMASQAYAEGFQGLELGSMDSLR